jgi:hypothetical protein
MRAVVRVVLLAVALLLGSRAAFAQCNTPKQDVFQSVTVSPTTLTLPTPGSAEFNAGFSGLATFTVNIVTTTGNRSKTYYLCLAATSTTFGSTVDGYTKALSDLEFSSNGSTWTAMTGTQALVASGVGNATYTIYLRSRLAYANDRPQANGAAATYGPVSLMLQVAY